MSEADTCQTNELVRVDSAQENNVSYPVQPTKPSLVEEIKRGWKWVVFIWRMLPRIGGFSGITKSLFVISSLLVTRLLTQWGLIERK